MFWLNDVDVTLEDGKVSVEFIKNVHISGKLIVAAYQDDGILIGVTMADVADLENNKSSSMEVTLKRDGAAYITAFIWDDIISMKPISKKTTKYL